MPFYTSLQPQYFATKYLISNATEHGNNSIKGMAENSAKSNKQSKENMKFAQSMNTYPCVTEGQTSEPFTHADSSMLVEDWQLLEGLLGTKYHTTQVSNFLRHFNFACCMKWVCI